MDSEDDLFDAYDMNSGEDDDYNTGYDDDEYHGDLADSATITSDRSQIDYLVLKEEDIRRHQKDDIGRVSMVLSISEVEARILLLHYHWTISKVDDAWFADEDRVRKTVGILKRPVFTPTPDHAGKITCGICFDSFLPEEIVSVPCGHPFCSTCWTGYISTAINDGPGCLMLKCPHPSCSAAVGQDMIERLASKEDNDRYSRYFLRSYIEHKRNIKWCPAPGCEHAIDFAAGTGSYDVSCLCSHSFCWNCCEEAHRPVNCDTVAQWIRKNSAESENMNWILANSKPCPKCKRPIEKNNGCMHMTCTPPCMHHFCWLCLNEWKDHGQTTGGYYACNRYEEAKKKGLHDEDEIRRVIAKESLERYAHYYERWASNQKSRQKALTDLQKMQSEKLAKLSVIQCTPETQLNFITEAWLQIIECRRVLKWTYAYGYYLPDHGKQQLFEFLQGEAESGLEKLHNCVEKDFEVFQDAQGPSQDFIHFQAKLIDLTSTTKTYFENLVKALENGLDDVDSQAPASKSTKSRKRQRCEVKASSKNGRSR